MVVKNIVVTWSFVVIMTMVVAVVVTDVIVMWAKPINDLEGFGVNPSNRNDLLRVVLILFDDFPSVVW